MTNGHNKIIFVHLLNDFSGSPKVLSQVINVLKENRSDIELFTGGKGNGFLSDLVTSQHRYYYQRFNHKILTLISYLLSQLSLFFKILHYRNEDVIIYVNTLLPFGAALAGKLTGKKVIYHIHETSISPKPLKYFLRIIVAFTASKIVFVSKSLANEESFDGIDQVVIYNGLDSSIVQKASTHIYQPIKKDNRFTVLMVCSLKGYKGVLQYLQLASSLEYDPDLEFELILNADENEMSEYFSRQKIPSNLTIYSKQTDLHPFYSNASLVLNLSLVDEWVETFGLTLLEAMAYGIPVIAPPVGGPTELVTEGYNGYLISAYELNTLKDMILTLNRNPALCLQLSDACLSQARRFSEDNFNNSILSLINSSNG